MIELGKIYKNDNDVLVRCYNKANWGSVFKYYMRAYRIEDAYSTPDYVVTGRGDIVKDGEVVKYSRDAISNLTPWVLDRFYCSVPTEEEQVPEQEDMVNNPSHYNQGGIETIDGIQAALGDEAFIDFCRGNVLKYAWRAGSKGNLAEDLRKAEWYARKAASVAEDMADGE